MYSTRTVAALDGKTIRLGGYPVPLETNHEGRSTLFFLVPYPGALHPRPTAATESAGTGALPPRHRAGRHLRTAVGQRYAEDRAGLTTSWRMRRMRWMRQRCGLWRKAICNCYVPVSFRHVSVISEALPCHTGSRRCRCWFHGYSLKVDVTTRYFLDMTRSGILVCFPALIISSWYWLYAF